MKLHAADNAAEIVAFFKDPEISYYSGNDCEPCVTYQKAAAMVDGKAAIIIDDDQGMAGIFVVERLAQFKVARIHIAMSSRARGRPAYRAAREALKLAETEGLTKLIADIPSYNYGARIMANAFGFIRTGVRSLVWPKDGINYDIIEYEKELTSCHRQ